MYTRALIPSVKAALADTPVVLVSGARQTGKSTLVRQLGSPSDRQYVTLDDSLTLSAAAADPDGFVASLDPFVTIDEVQRVPDLFRVIKATVDRDRRPGRFLLTGSANVFLLPRVSESLAGRMEIVTLWPLAQSEMAGLDGSVVDWLFSASLTKKPGGRIGTNELLGRLLVGGYPEPNTRNSDRGRRSWFDAYTTAVIQRDVRDIASIERLKEMPRLLSLLASRTSNLLNLSDIARTVSIPYATLNRYMAILEATYLVQLLPAWAKNVGAKLAKAPKVMLNDSALAARLRRADQTRIIEDGTLLGPLLETFVAMELLKHAGWSESGAELYHYRTKDRFEVDIVLEDASGRIVGVEVKASATLGPSDFRGLRSLAEATGDRFVRGVVLYSGGQLLPFGKDMYAVPLSVLWS